jgi:hypothetical protein
VKLLDTLCEIRDLLREIRDLLRERNAPRPTRSRRAPPSSIEVSDLDRARAARICQRLGMR